MFESHTWFMQLQRLAASGSVGRRDLLRVCRHYRSCTEAVAQQVENSTLRPMDDEGQEEVAAAILMYRDIHMTWELCEILYVDPESIISRLPLWYQLHVMDPEIQESLKALAAIEQQPERHDQYWTCIYKLVIAGKLEDARLLLQRHSRAASMPARPDARADVFSVLDTLLKALAKIRAIPSAGEFRTSWEQWRHDCSYVHRSAFQFH